MMKKILIVVVIAILIAGLAVAWGAFYFLTASKLEAPASTVLRIIAGIISGGSVLGLTIVLVERIKELRRGEEDDLSNY